MLIINKLGGNAIKTIPNSTHFVVSCDKIEKLKKRKTLDKSTNFVNLKWLFHSFFSYKRMPEDDEEYLVNL